MTEFDFITFNDEPIGMVDYTDFLASSIGYAKDVINNNGTKLYDDHLYTGKIIVYIEKPMSLDDIVEMFQDSIGSMIF